MAIIETLLPGIQSFLSVDLSTIQLPPHVEQKRQRFLELIEVLSLGPIPPLPKNSHITTNPVTINTVTAGCHGSGDIINTTNTITTTNNNNYNVTVLQRRPLSSSIARFFSNKRYSLPPTISCPSPPSVLIDSFKTPVTTTSGTSVDKRNSQVSDIFQSSSSSSGHSIHGISYESPSDNKSVHSFGRTRNSLITSVPSTLPPPLPPKKSQQHKLFCKLDDPYEVPKHATTVLVTKTNTATAAEPATSLTSSLSASSTITPIRSKSSITSTNQLLYRKKQFNRLSLSPQLEIIQDKKTNSTVPHDWLDNNTAVSEGTTTLVDSVGLSDTIHTIKQDRTLVLPKKNVTGCQARRPSSSLTDPIWTLAGILSHRYKSNKWIQLNLCLLTNNSRLVAYKTGHSMTPSLALFLYGSTGIYSGRDSGMEHVIKIVHSSREIIVLAAPTEEQALIWVRQINQYSQGSIPTEVCSFLPHLNVPNSINTQTSPTTFTNNTNKNTTDRNFTSPQLSSCNNRSSMDVTDLQSDSEFLTLNKTICIDSIPSVNPTKSPSFDNRNVGLLITSCEINSQRNRKAEKSVTNHRITTPIDDVINTNDSSLNGSGMTDSIHHCLSSSVVIPSRPLSSMTLSSVFDSSTISIKQNSRRSSLISSMRRKVESFSSKRRIRKSLPQSLQPSTNGYSNVSQNEMVLTGHRRMLSDGQWKNNLSSSKFSSVQCLQQQSQHMISSPPLPPPPAACVWDSSGNSGKGFGWSHLVSAGVRFLNQHTTPTVIPSSTNNGRPRSVRYDSSAATSDLFSSQICLTSNYGPLLDLNTIRPHSTAPYTIDASNDNHIVISGDAFISIPDQVPWTIKWCCLKLNCLEIYQNSRKDYYSKISQNSNEYIDENYNWPIFSLPLNSDKVELGLAGSSDKRHSSAIRLAVPTECTTPLLFDAIDKSQMGSWIRGFIQALGLVGPIDVAQQKNYSLHRMSSIGPKNTVLLHPPCVSVQENHIHSVPLIKNHTVLPLTTTMNPLTSTSLIHRIPNSIMETSQTSMYYSDIHDNDVDDDVNDLVDNSNNSNNPFFVNVEKQETSSSSSNMVIYDEVCPPQPSFATTMTTANTPVTSLLSSTDTTRNPPSLSKRRWSSPLLIVDSCTKFPGSFYLSNIESNNALLTNNNSSNNNNHNKSSNWHIIPPPSRRLLAQPLPPLPSVGPSTCESMAGTITSDGSCTSSNITPDDFVGCVDDVNDDNNGYQDEDERVKLIRSINMNLETDNYPLYWSKKDKTLDNCNLPSSTLNRRYASMSSLEYSLPFNESSTNMYDYNNNNNSSTNDQKKPKRKDGNKSILKQFLSHKQCHSWINNNENDNNKAENNNNSTLDIMNNSGSNSVCKALMTDGIYSSPLCTAFTFISESDNSTLHKADSDLVTSDTTNTTCTTTATSTCTNVFSNDGDNDNISRRNSGDEVSLCNVKAENFLCSRDPALVEYMKSSKLISARRCVSCLTGNKPTVLQKNSNIDGIPISSSTLPVRCGSDDTATAIMNTEAITSDPVLCQKLNKHWNRNSYSSNSSRTATSSGVALTAEFSSPGSGGTTRPSSVAMPNYHPPVTLVEEEQTNIENSPIHVHNDWYDLPLNLGQLKDTRKYQSSSDYGCQVEIPTSNLSILNCHQYSHNLVNNMNENNIKDSVTVKDSIPHSTSLTLITSQLDEIKQETNSLRSVIRNLSFQLSDHLARDCCDQCVKNAESLPKSDVVDISTSNSEILLDQGNTPIDKNLFKNNNNNNMPNGCNRKVVRMEDQETTTNFYARLTAVEMLLRNAESTEARLEKEFSHLIINDEKSSLPPPPSSLSTAIFMEDLKPEQEQRILDEKSLINKCIQDNEYVCSRCKNNNTINNISRNKLGKIEHQGCKLNSSFQQKIINTIPLSSYRDRSHSGLTRRRQRQRQHHHHCVAVDSSNYSKPSNCNIIEAQTIECCSQVTVSSSLSS